MSNDSQEYNLYELIDQFIEEGYSADEAENLAWKMIQGNPANWPKTDKTDSKSVRISKNDDDIPF